MICEQLIPLLETFATQKATMHVSDIIMVARCAAKLNNKGFLASIHPANKCVTVASPYLCVCANALGDYTHYDTRRPFYQLLNLITESGSIANSPQPVTSHNMQMQ
jgi:hypothetical protein